MQYTPIGSLDQTECARRLLRFTSPKKSSGSLPEKITVAEFTLTKSGTKVDFPLDAIIGKGTYYLTSISDEGVCSPGCGSIKVVETQTGEAVDTFWEEGDVYLYDCDITVTSSSNVFPRSLPPHQASPAARAIGLSGAIPQLGDSEYVFYQLNVTFGLEQKNNATAMARELSRGTILVIAAAAQTNRMTIHGPAPTQGLRLTLDHPVTFNLILGLIASFQLLLVVATAIACRRIVIPKQVLQTRRETLRTFVLPG